MSQLEHEIRPIRRGEWLPGRCRRSGKAIPAPARAELVIPLMAVLIVCALGAAKQKGTEADAEPRILFDQTHEFLFAVGKCAQTLRSRGVFCALSERTLTADLIRNVDVVMIHQAKQDVPVTDDEAEALKAFVMRGGGLLLVGNGVAHLGKVNLRRRKRLPVRYADLQLNRLATVFGFRFSETPVAGEVEIQQNPFATHLVGKKVELSAMRLTAMRPAQWCAVEMMHSGEDADVLLRATSAKQPQQGVILAARPFGKGRVAALGGTDFASLIVFPETSHGMDQFFIGLMRWLGENSASRRGSDGLSFREVFSSVERDDGLVKHRMFICPEIWTRMDGLIVNYNRATQEEALRVMKHAFPAVRKVLHEIYGRPPVKRGKTDQLIRFFANAGSGYAGPNIVGLPGLNDTPERGVAPYKYGVIQHEMTHAWGLPMGLSGHLLMNFNGVDLCEHLPEIRDHLRSGWARNMAQLRKVDPALTELDIAVLPDKRGSRMDRLRWKKWTWVFRLLRRRYGEGYFKKVIALSDAEGIGAEEDVSTLMHFLCT